MQSYVKMNPKSEQIYQRVADKRNLSPNVL